MKFVIWGAGTYGVRMLHILRNHDVVAFIDRDENKIGNLLEGIPVISLNEYKEKYSSALIIVAMRLISFIRDVVRILEENDIHTYLPMNNNPSEAMIDWSFEIPFEEMLEERRIDLNKTRVALLGLSVFALLLYEYLESERCSCCLIDDGFHNKMRELLKRNYNITKLQDVSKKSDCVLLTVKHNSNAKFPFARTIQFYSFADLKRYQNIRLKDLLHAPKSERCFICATGPSLTVEDLDKICCHKDDSFGVNRAYVAFKLTKWRPTYYVVSDRYPLEADMDDYVSLPVDYCLFSDWSDKFWKEKEKEISKNKSIYKYHLSYDGFDADGPQFSENICQGAYDGASVVYDCLQFACMMGYKEIYLVGADCSISGNGYEQNDHFIKDYYDVRRHLKSQRVFQGFGNLFIAYRKAREYAEAHGIKIFNATRGGKLEVFERVDFDSLF